MGAFYTDEQVREAIAALESFSPGIWEKMKSVALMKDDPANDELEVARTAIVRVLTIILPTVSFVAQAENKKEARLRLSIDVGNAVRAEIARENAGSRRS